MTPSHHRTTLLPALLVALLHLGVPATPAAAAEILVSSFSDLPDAAPGDGTCNAVPDAFPPVCTLRAAVQEANAQAPGPHVIRLPAGTYFLTHSPTFDQQTEDSREAAGSLTSVEAAATNDLDVDVSVRIFGAGQHATIIDAGGLFRVFDFGLNGQAEIHDLTVQHGFVRSRHRGGGGVLVGGSAVLFMRQVTVQQSEAQPVAIGGRRGTSGRGGGIEVVGSLTMRRSTIRENRAEQLGGGIHVNGLLEMDESTVTGNVVFGNQSISLGPGDATAVAYGSGGGISGHAFFNGCSDVRITNSTISQNTSGHGEGGGLAVVGALQLLNSTVSGNRSRLDGGGLLYRPCGISGPTGPPAVLTARYTTIADNTVLTHPATPGIHVGAGTGSAGSWRGLLWARNQTLIGDPGNCGGAVARIVSDGYNLEDGFTCGLTGPFDKVGVFVDLGPLADNGGPTSTHAIAPSPVFGHPAIDAGGAPGFPNRDQRGRPRPQGAAWDIGAFEYEDGGGGPPWITEVPVAVPDRVTFLAGYRFPIVLGGAGAASASIDDIGPGDVGGTFEAILGQDGLTAVVTGKGIDLAIEGGQPPILFTVFVNRPLQAPVELRVVGGEIDGTTRYDAPEPTVFQPIP